MPKILFTAQNAREMSLRAKAARQKIREEQAARADAIRSLTGSEPAPVQVRDLSEHYDATRLLRVREQLRLLDKKILTLIESEEIETAGAIDRLASAQARLAEQARILSGRPLPGSLRPRGSTAPKTASSAPIAEEHGTEDAS